MQCPQCKHENTGGKFCGECGARLELRCAACGEPNPPSNKFCQECGERLTAAPTPATSSAPSPAAYTPRHLAERILSSRGVLEGERKQVTVLFADLKGSMELLADRDPEEARAILDPVLERMMEAVHRYEGTVNQVMGDGIMALFGAPLAHEDHAIRACYAALRMQEAVKHYAQEVQRTHGLPLHIRVGLNSGGVVVRSIGSDLRMDYTAVGQTTHLAARMEQMAMPGSVLLAPDTLHLAEGYVQVRGLGPMAVKGLARPVEVYELLGAGTARSRLQAAAAQGLTKFVGRDAELETLRRTLEQAGSGHGQVVALVGEPGVGKSRLVWEFTHSHRTRGWLVLGSGSVSYGKATSYLPIIDLLKRYCSIDDRDDARRVRERVTGKVLTLDPALQSLLPPLLALLDVPVDDPAWAGLDPPQRRARTLDALRRLFLWESQEQPLLLVFEDLHWIDTETQTLLDSLVESIPTARILLLVNYRPEYEHTWHRKTYYQQLRLDPLPPESADALLAALLGDAEELLPLKRVLIERTEGNPFFVEESVRTLVESGVLAGERGSYRPTRPFESTQVPATVQAVLAARIDRLAPEDKRLLQTTAVIGKDVPYPLLLAIADLSEDALRQELARLHAAECLYETSLFPEPEYTFKHALTHEVTYGSLLQERRRTLHARIVAAIETLYADRQTEYVELLAHHALRGEVWAKAVGYQRQAGAKATSRSAYREAAGHLEQAILALVHLPEDPETRGHAIDLRFELYRSLLPLGELIRADGVHQELEGLAEALGDPIRLVRVYAMMAARCRRDGDYERCVELAQRALALASAVQELKVEDAMHHNLGMAYFALGNYRAAVECFQRNMALARVGEISSQIAPLTYPVVARAWAAESLAQLGEFAESTRLAAEALRDAEATNLPWDLAMTLLAVGEVHLDQGVFAVAVSALERGMALSESADITYFSRLIATRLGYAYALTGRVADALPLLEGKDWRPGMPGLGTGESRLVAHLSEAYLLAGRLADAGASAGRAVDLARQHNERGNEAWGLRILGEIAAHADSPDIQQTERYYGQAIALAEKLGTQPIVAHCHLGLGTLYQKIGRDEQARAELTAASEMYRAMDMSFWRERAESALAQVAS